MWHNLFCPCYQVRFNAIDWKVSLRLHCTLYVLRKEISLTTIWNFLYKAPLTGVFLQVHYSYLWSSFATKKIYQEHEKKSKYITDSVRGNISFVCILQSNWKVPLDIIFIHIRLRAPLRIFNLYTTPTRKARVSVSVILILFCKYNCRSSGNSLRNFLCRLRQSLTTLFSKWQ